MATPPDIKGGSFLIESRRPEEIFRPEDLTDQHRLIARTADEFVRQEIVPRLKEIEGKKPGLSRELLKKAAEFSLCAVDVPQKYGGLELDKISSILVWEEMARRRLKRPSRMGPWLKRPACSRERRTWFYSLRGAPSSGTCRRWPKSRR
jgi:hypothetical protein